MKTVCVLIAVAILIGFTAVNLFIPYALAALAFGLSLVYFLGIPCGLLTRDRRGECRLGVC